jgi:hypothetical protein
MLDPIFAVHRGKDIMTNLAIWHQCRSSRGWRDKCHDNVKSERHGTLPLDRGEEGFCEFEVSLLRNPNNGWEFANPVVIEGCATAGVQDQLHGNENAAQSMFGFRNKLAKARSIAKFMTGNQPACYDIGQLLCTSQFKWRPHATGR